MSSTPAREWIKGYALVENRGKQPPDAALLGNETDTGHDLALAIAHTDKGQVPGKARGNTCWYGYGGKEYTASVFFWVVAKDKGSLKLVPDDANGPPPRALKLGLQIDRGERYYCAVAMSDHGQIPGKAKGCGCWYSYDGKEMYTKHFSWVVHA